MTVPDWIVRKAAARGDLARVEAMMSREEARIRRAFRRYLDDVRSREVVREIVATIRRGGPDLALRALDPYVERLGDVIPRVFVSVGEQEADALDRRLARKASVGVRFDSTDLVVADMMRSSRLEFVREFSQSQRAAVRGALSDALSSGAGPLATARTFRENIGLTGSQRDIVANYRRMLETGDPGALDRVLRDRRYDPSVARAVEGGEPLPARTINTMVSGYRNRLLALRAETIARTEMLRALNQARMQALWQALDQTGIPPGAASRTWRATRDLRTRFSHTGMDGQTRPMTEPFVSPLGAQLMMPGDSTLGAPAEEVINCRCVVLFDV